MNDHPQASSPFRTSQLEENDGPGHNTSGNPTMGEVISSRFSRRGLLKGSLAVAAISATVSPIALILADEARAEGASAFSFDELEAGVDDRHHVAPGYDADVLLRWGDPIFTDAPEFDPANQTAEAQARQFGYNNDYVGFIPIDGSSEHGLLVVNHEYTNPHLMFPGLVKIVEGKVEQGALSKEQVDIEMAAHGGTIVEIRKVDGKFQPVLDSSLNRRITANTEMMLTGPAAGHDRLKTNADPSGTRVLGTVNDCAGGVTPWGTYVMAEENIHGYFAGELPADHREAANHERMGVPDASYEWANFYERFDVGKEPNEPNRFGWMVEVDVTDPNSTPKKRTAMGRFKHEGAESIVVPDGRVVFYLGDDERFDYVYKFVTAGRFNPDDRAANMDLLDEGTLYTAKFSDDGSVEWMPLVQGEGPLTAENGFESQADVLIETRRAADLLGATKMDRPEDMEANPVTNKVYLMLTNNNSRTAEQTDAANPRARNAFGHVIEITPADGDNHARPEFTWDILLRCGDPAIAEVGATFNAATSENGWFGMPDNCAVDHMGRLWITTDGNSLSATGRADGVWAIETEGELRGTSRHFFRVPVGAEMCGPYFTPDDRTLFLAVQHPGSGGGSTFEAPTTRWPDFKPAIPPRPSVVAVTKNNGGPIGGKPRKG